MIPPAIAGEKRQMTDTPPNGPEAQWRAFLAQGRFMIQRSRSTGRCVFYPRVMVPGTGETDLEWVPASGEGVVYATTANRSKEGATNIAIIELAEGPRMMSRVEGVPADAVKVGDRVKARIATLEDSTLNIVFDRT
jgi:uncharacterized OB-fold protein